MEIVRSALVARAHLRYDRVRKRTNALRENVERSSPWQGSTALFFSTRLWFLAASHLDECAQGAIEPAHVGAL